MQECGDCTLCCKLCNILETGSPSGEYCSKCVPNLGCSIHGDHPIHCKTFLCCYAQMEKVHIDLRPDKCNVMFEKITDFLILGTVDGKLEDISDLVKGQIGFFINEGISVYLQKFNPNQFTCYMAQGAKRKEIVQALEDKYNDSTKLYGRPN